MHTRHTVESAGLAVKKKMVDLEGGIAAGPGMRERVAQEPRYLLRASHFGLCLDKKKPDRPAPRAIGHCAPLKHWHTGLAKQRMVKK